MKIELVLGVVILFLLIGGAIYTIFKMMNSLGGEVKSAFPLSLEQYLAQNPHCKTNFGIKCSTCNSNRIHRKVVANTSVFSCNSCSTNLYHVDA